MINNKICIIGGGGHVGLPLGLMLAKKKFEILLLEKNKKLLNLIRKKKYPYKEVYGQEYLNEAYKKKKLNISSKILDIKHYNVLIICIGTPIKKNLKPDIKYFLDIFFKIKNILNKNHHIIIRSSIYPGVLDKVKNILKTNNISYCPERIVQGESLIELSKLPQIIAGYNKATIKLSSEIFKKITKKIIFCSMLEAEFIKLFTNTYRYIHFSIANQFYLICKTYNINFFKLRKKMMLNYARMQSFPPSGVTAGPCLLKDTMQLSSFSKENFLLGKAAMKINDNLPIHIYKNLKKKIDFRNKIIGILGLSFKAESDDIRDSVSIKFIKYLKKKKIKYLFSDPHYKNNKIKKINYVIKNSDIIFLMTPHKQYKNIFIPENKIFIDVWNFNKI